MRFEATAIEGLFVIRLDPHRDERGTFGRFFCEAEFAEVGVPFHVVQASISRNVNRHTLRGMHFQRPPHAEAKIISCPRGRIWDAAIDLRGDSATYRRWVAFELGPDTDSALLLPRGIAHGFITLEPDSEVQYMMDAAFAADAGTGVRWNDPAIGITWPAEPAVISERDRNFALLDDPS